MPVFEIKTRGLMHYVEITLDDESVRTEAGAGRYWLGAIAMTNPMPSLAGMIKSKITGNKIFRPVYTGTGTLVLTPRFHEFIPIELKNSRMVLEKGAYWASDMEVEVGVHANRLSAGLMSGEGFLQTAVSGAGTVIASSPGPVEIVDLKDEQLVLDGAYAVARSANLSYSVRQASRNLIATATSGEGFVQVLEGTGRVYLSAIPNHSVALQELMLKSLTGIIAARQKD